MNPRNLPSVLILTIASLFFSSCSIVRLFEQPDDFIRVQGTQFSHNGKPYYFAGTNMWYGCYLGSPGPTGDRSRLLRELDSLKLYGITNLRVLAASEESSIGRSVKPAIQTAPGVINDTLLQGLDFLLAEMAKRRMYAVLYLGNYWEWSGGMSQYNVWTGEKSVDPEDTTQGWPAFMNFSATFYANQKANKMYRDYVGTLLKRKNSVNGRMYSEDPSIMSWQLANEPRPAKNGTPGREDLSAFNRWIDETASYIHSLDTNHLVSAGSEGTVGTLRSDEYYLNAYRTPNIDYLNLHLWPLNWGWFNPSNWETTLPASETESAAYINQHLALARKLGKPIVMEEFGMGRDGGGIIPGSPTRARDQFYRFVFYLVEDSARAGAPIAGTNFWAWGGEGVARHPDGMWQPGDPFVGDPPQEPQGRNSIFNADTSTIWIIRHHAERMKILEGLPQLKINPNPVHSPSAATNK